MQLLRAITSILFYFSFHASHFSLEKIKSDKDQTECIKMPKISFL